MKKRICGNCRNYRPYTSYNGECSINLPYWFNNDQIRTEAIVEKNHNSKNCNAYIKEG